jgi:FkbM family methyltransferase
MSLRTWLRKRSSKRRDQKYRLQREAFDRVVAAMTAQDVAIDCGANVGLFTVPMAETGAEVHAFEPNPDAFQELERVTKGYANVTLHQAAVTAEPGPVDLYLHKRADDDPVFWSKSSSLLADKSNVREDQSVRVEGIQLGRFIQDLGRPVKLLKMDIEGAEVDVLNQLLDEGLHESIEHAFVEVHDRRVKRLAEPTQRLRDRLQELDASHFRLDWR